MPYRKDPWIVSIIWGRIGAAVLCMVALVLGLLGYTLTPEDQNAIVELIGKALPGVGGVLIIASKIRESKKTKED